MFNHNLIPLPELIRIDGDMRFYQTPDGNKYPSVTTVLDKTSDKSFLEAWRARVGEEAANRKSSMATLRGTNVHRMCENLVMNLPNDFRHEMPISVMMYKQLERFLIQNVDNVRVSEGSLFSHKLKIAGSVDLVADYKGKLSVIDFKTSEKEKRIDWIENYFIQATMYAYMMYEMTGLLCSTIVIAICLEQDDKPQIFVESPSNFLDLAIKKCNDFHSQFALTSF